jgi:hypothetical protein
MGNRLFYIITVIFLELFASLYVYAQPQPSVYKVIKMSFNTGEFSEISPVIIKDGILFCSSRRFSGFKDRTTFDNRRLYNIYLVEKKDSSEWSKPVEMTSQRSTFFNNGPLCIAPDGKTVYFTSEVETGKAATKRNFKNHSGIFTAEMSGATLSSVRPFK